MCSLINKQLLLTAYAYLFITEQQKGQQGSEALQVERVEQQPADGKTILFKKLSYIAGGNTGSSFFRTTLGDYHDVRYHRGECPDGETTVGQALCKEISAHWKKNEAWKEFDTLENNLARAQFAKTASEKVCSLEPKLVVKWGTRSTEARGTFCTPEKLPAHPENQNAQKAAQEDLTRI